MIKVITYGTFDYLHQGHINLLKRAKALGDYLIVGVTSDDFDIQRGKLNVQQTLMERINAVKETGLADEIIPEEYEGQKIDDIKRYGIDIFTVGSDWSGKFDYLKEFCKVVYLERTKGVSSTLIRQQTSSVDIGIAGYSTVVQKFIDNCQIVSGFNKKSLYLEMNSGLDQKISNQFECVYYDYDTFLKSVSAVYFPVNITNRTELIKKALLNGKHVLVESPIAHSQQEIKDLFQIAKENNVILFEALKTAYIMAFNRLILLLKTGIIGNVKAIDVTCTSLSKIDYWGVPVKSSMDAWGPTALLPILLICGTEYQNVMFKSFTNDDGSDFFTESFIQYKDCIANLKVGNGVKSEGALIVSGTSGYIYVPSPWWKTDYFEIRFEDFSKNQRFYYKLQNEGIAMEVGAFLEAIRKRTSNYYIGESVSLAIGALFQKFDEGKTK